MNLPKENINFWKIIEKDLATAVPGCIKNCLFMCGFGGAASIRNLGDEQIKGVEDFVRSKLEKKLQAFNIEESEFIHFFGPEFVDCQNEFEFTVGDRILLKEISSYTSSVKLEHFKMNQKGGRNPIHGYYRDEYLQFNNFISNHHNDETFNLPDLKQKLFEKVVKTLKSFQMPTDQFKEPTLDMVSVHADSKFKVTGSIVCSFCENVNINVYLKKESPTSMYWIISNFATHLKRFHKLKLESEAKEDKESLPSQPTEKNESSPNSTIFEPVEVQTKNDTNGLSWTHVRSFISLNGSQTIEIEETSTRMEEFMYQSISNQTLKMMEVSLKTKDKCEEVRFLVDSEILNFEVAKVKPDGNCMFRSLAHQLFGQKLHTKEQNSTVAKLRADVIEHIEKHKDEFMPLLRQNLLERNKSEDTMDLALNDEETENKCLTFLKTILSKPGEWGSGETLKAVSEMYSANVVIMHEEGPCFFFNGFDVRKEKCLIVAYRLAYSGDKKNGKRKNLVTHVRNHYDSVIKIDQDVVLKCVKKYLATKDDIEIITID